MSRKRREKRMAKRSGFTLIEIILVVVIIGILAGIAIPRMGGKTERAQITQAKANIQALSAAIQEYEIDKGSYPSGLDDLLQKDDAGRQYWPKAAIPTDPWGKPYSYSPNGSHGAPFDLSCTTQKGKTIANWE